MCRLDSRNKTTRLDSRRRSDEIPVDLPTRFPETNRLALPSRIYLEADVSASLAAIRGLKWRRDSENESHLAPVWLKRTERLSCSSTGPDREEKRRIPGDLPTRFPENTRLDSRSPPDLIPADLPTRFPENTRLDSRRPPD
ncbi:hypothetical protein Bbelb_120820 [Branchiostoma belcheri]|nr:hypothetical protein Bbelb_120820 [Branchiostoma belcheri]